MQDLKAIEKESEIATAYTVRIIEEKLPDRVHLKWLEQEQSETGYQRFMDLIKFLKEERKRVERMLNTKPERVDNSRRSANSLQQQLQHQHQQQQQQQQRQQKRQQQQQGRPRNMCLIHPNARHLTRKCNTFKDKPLNDRCQLVSDMGACALCLTILHPGEECPKRATFRPCDIDGCNRYHSRLLHGCTVAGLQFHIQHTDHLESHTLLLFQTIVSELQRLVVFWDNGSQISLVTRAYASKQGLRGIHVTYDLVTINDVKTQETILYDVPVTDRSGQTHIIKAYEIERICEDTDTVNLGAVVKLFRNLKETAVARPNQQVDLLIGMNYTSLHPDKISTSASLALFKSLFGTGRILGGNHKAISSNRKLTAHAKIVAKASIRNVRVAKGVDFFTAEGFGVNVPPKCNRCKHCSECKWQSQHLSRIEQRELEAIRENLQHDPVIRWIQRYSIRMEGIIGIKLLQL